MFSKRDTLKSLATSDKLNTVLYTLYEYYFKYLSCRLGDNLFQTMFLHKMRSILVNIGKSSNYNEH